MFCGRVGLLDRDRISGFRRALVIDENHRGVGADGDLAGHAVMGLLVAKDPAAAMEVHHDRQRAARALRPDDANPHRSGGADGKGRVLDGGRQLGDRLGLSAGQDVTGGIRAQGVDRRAAAGGQRVDELLGRRLQTRSGRRRAGAGFLIGHVSLSLCGRAAIRRGGRHRR
jgi:hypothetical protein